MKRKPKWCIWPSNCHWMETLLVKCAGKACSYYRYPRKTKRTASKLKEAK